jgi:predicted nucleic-acid-binding protein
MGLVQAGTLDTNILLRFLLGDQPAQFARAKKLIIDEPRIWHISMLSIAEIVFVLEGMGFTRQEIKRNVDTLSGYRNLYFARAVATPALELYVRRPALSFIDACLVFEATAESAELLWTFDKKLARQAPATKLLQ